MPFVVELISNAAEELGVVVPIPTLPWLYITVLNRVNAKTMSNNFFISSGFSSDEIFRLIELHICTCVADEIGRDQANDDDDGNHHQE